MSAAQSEQADSIEVWRSLSDAWKRLYRAAERNLASAEISFTEFRILRLLNEEGLLSMVNMANSLLITQAAITGIIDRLEKQGLVKRGRNREDRRVIHVSITPKGREISKKAGRLHRNFVEKALQSLTESDVADMLNALTKMGNAIENSC